MVLEEKLKEACRKEIEEMGNVFKNIKILNTKGAEIFNLSLSYFYDAKYFFEKGDFISSFEAIIISWAYIDVGLHLEFFEIPQELKKYFTLNGI